MLATQPIASHHLAWAEAIPHLSLSSGPALAASNPCESASSIHAAK